MRNEEIKAELAALRSEVVALAEARKQESAQKPTLIESEDEPESVAEHEGFMGQVQELVELLEEELKETPVMSGLVIFSVGILVGRFLR